MLPVPGLLQTPIEVRLAVRAVPNKDAHQVQTPCATIWMIASEIAFTWTGSFYAIIDMLAEIVSPCKIVDKRSGPSILLPGGGRGQGLSAGGECWLHAFEG
jgi:hypothetical protein